MWHHDVIWFERHVAKTLAASLLTFFVLFIFWRFCIVYFLTFLYCLFFDVFVLFIFWRFCIVYFLTFLYCLFFDVFVLFIFWRFCIVYFLTFLYCLFFDVFVLFISDVFVSFISDVFCMFISDAYLSFISDVFVMFKKCSAVMLFRMIKCAAHKDVDVLRLLSIYFWQHVVLCRNVHGRVSQAADSLIVQQKT